MGKAMIIRDTFEAIYPDYPFASLVRAGIAIAAWLCRRNELKGTTGRSGGGVGTALGSAA